MSGRLSDAKRGNAVSRRTKLSLVAVVLVTGIVLAWQFRKRGEEATNAAAPQMGCDRISQDRAKLISEVRETVAACFLEHGDPPTCDSYFALLEHRTVASREAINAIENSTRRWNHVEVEVVENRLRG